MFIEIAKYAFWGMVGWWTFVIVLFLLLVVLALIGGTLSELILKHRKRKLDEARLKISESYRETEAVLKLVRELRDAVKKEADKREAEKPGMANVKREGSLQ